MPSTNKNLKIAAILQARMTSSRLPGKVLMKINEKPMLWHVVNRLKHCQKIDDIILAIPQTEKNDVLEKFAEQNQINYFRGSEQDVLARFYETAKKFSCDLIARITADCPLVDPKIVDGAIEKHLNSKADYTSNMLKRTFPRGLEVEIFNFEVLEKAYYGAKERHQREHVTPYLYEQPDVFKLQSIEAKGKLKRPELRLTVDTKEDLWLVREIYKHLAEPEKIFYTEEIIDLFKQCPGLSKINEEVRQKDLLE